MAKKPTTLLDETELLVRNLVKDARGKKTIIGEDGKERQIPFDILDKTRAADVALRFLTVKHKIDPEKPEASEYERDVAEFHGLNAAAESDAAPDEDAARVNGAGGHG